MTNCCDDWGNCNQGRECPVRNYRTWSTNPVVDRERAAQEAWLALVRRSGAGAGVHAGDVGAPGPLPTDWGVVTIIALAVLAFVASMVMLYMGLPVVVAALPVVQAMVLELIREVIA